MFRSNLRLTLLFCLTLIAPSILIAGGQSAKAEGSFVSFWGGYFYTDAPELEGITMHSYFPPPTTYRTSPHHGGFFGASFGTPSSPLAALFRHAEFYFEGLITDTDSVSNNGFIDLPYANGNYGTVMMTTQNFTETERQRYELGTRLSGGPLANLPFDPTLTIFGGFGREDSIIQQTGLGLNTTVSDLDWNFFGFLLGTNITMPLGGGIDFVYTGSTGVYVYNAEGDFTTTLFGVSHSVSDDDTGFGFRSKSRAELRSTLTPGIIASIFGEVDYWSNVPHSQLIRIGIDTPPRPAHVNNDDVTDVKGGLQIKILLDGQ